MYDAFTKSMLRNGDFIKRRSGEIGLVLTDIGVVMYKNGRYSDLKAFSEQLTNNLVPYDGDIVEVFRPRSPRDCSFSRITKNPELLIFKRNEPGCFGEDVLAEMEIPDDAIEDPADVFGF